MGTRESKSHAAKPAGPAGRVGVAGLAPVIVAALIFLLAPRAGAEESQILTGTRPNWSCTVSLFQNSGEAGVGRRIGDRWELQTTISGSVRNLEWAYAGYPAYAYELSGGQLDILCGVLWNAGSADRIRFWVGPEFGLRYSEFVGTLTDPEPALDDGVEEVRSGFARMYGAVELDVFAGLSAIAFLRSPTIRWERHKATGLFAQFSDTSPAIETGWNASARFQPRVALRIRF